MTEETPVLIAGAGPTGLALAATRSPSCRHDASSPGAAARDTARWPVPWYGLAATGSATMSTTSTTDLADYVIATVRAHEAELRRAGVRHLSLFGSVARGEAADESDVDLLVELDPDAHIGLFALGALEQRLAELVGRPVDLLPEPVEKPRLQARIDRDRRRAF